MEAALSTGGVDSNDYAVDARGRSASGRPKVLRVETGFASAQVLGADKSPWTDVIDYREYDRVPRWWRRVEEWLRLDLVLAFRAHRRADRYGAIWACSERVGIPLVMLRRRPPVVCVFQHPASARKRALLRLSGLARRWAGVGWLTESDRDFLSSYYGIPAERLLPCSTVAIDLEDPVSSPGGPIVALGVAKRDYATLFAALSDLPEARTEVFAHSRYGDKLKGMLAGAPPWVTIRPPAEDVSAEYRRARFVVMTLKGTTQFSAGSSVILEAGACGKAVIATRMGGSAGVVEDGVTGLLVAPHDVAGLRAAIRKLCDDPDLAERLGRAAQERVRERFEKGVVTLGIIGFLRRLGDHSRRPPRFF